MRSRILSECMTKLSVPIVCFPMSNSDVRTSILFMDTDRGFKNLACVSKAILSHNRNIFYNKKQFRLILTVAFPDLSLLHHKLHHV